MAISFHKEVTTPEALASSIDTDQHVLRWFTLFIVQPAVQARGMDNPTTQKLYAALKGIVTQQFFLYLFLEGAFVVIVFLKLYPYFWLGALFIFPGLFLHARLKKCVREISLPIVLTDFDNSTLRQKTLYQISEFYSRQYHFPSLVDNIFKWDNATRIIVIAAAILSGQMIPLIINIYRVNFVLTFLGLHAAGYLIFATIHTLIIYKHLQTFPQRKVS